VRIRIQTAIFCLLFQASLLVAQAQDHDIKVSGQFHGLPFTEFVSEVEAHSNVRFFYLENWVSGIKITASGENLSLKKILDRALIPIGIRYYLDKSGNIFLVYDQPLITELPEYTLAADSAPERRGVDESGTLTQAEQRYIDGHQAGMLEILEVGDPDTGGGDGDAVIHGRMIDAGTGEPLIGATIYVEALKKGAATDVDGRFSIVLKPGRHRVTFNCMGMKPRQNILEVHSGGSLVIRMDKGLIPINEVLVKADRYHNVKGNQMGFERLNYRTTKEVPVVLGEKDLLKVAQLLPGVQSVGEGSQGFNVRGGSADQNMIYVNRVPVYNGSHMFGFFTAFSPDIVKDFSLYKSNLPANYGGRLSSIFDISTRQGNMKHFTAHGGISPITGHVAVEGPVIKDKGAFVVSARSTYSDWILRQLDDPDLRNSNVSFYDLSGTGTYAPNEKNLLKVFAYYSSDRFTLGSSNDYTYHNAGSSVSLKHRFGSQLTADLALVFGQYAFNTVNTENASAAYTHDYRINHSEFKSDFTWLSLGKHRLTYGASGILYGLRKGVVAPYGDLSIRNPVDLGSESGIELAGYLADEISLSRRLTLYLGFRYCAFLNMGPGEVLLYSNGESRIPGNVSDTLLFSRGEVVKSYHGPEPRVSVTYLIGQNNSVKASYNRVNQYLVMLSNTFAISPTDQWKLADYHLVPPSVDQVSLGYYHDFPEAGIQTSAEVYYKDYDHVLEYKDGASFINTPNIETQVVQGEQESWGLELMMRKNAGKLNGWLAYSYSRSMVLFNSPVPGEYINGGKTYSSIFDRPHNLNLVANYKLNRRLSVSATLVYITGRPVTYPVSIYYREGIQYLEYSDRNQYRIPDYFRTDLSVNLEGNLKRKKLAHSFWMLSVYNLTGRNNPYSVYFRSEEGVIKGYKLSIFGQPVITLSWNFKFGNYASE